MNWNWWVIELGEISPTDSTQLVRGLNNDLSR